MIPFFQANVILLGPLTIQVWGLLVSLGIISGVILARILAKRFFLSADVILDLGFFSLIGGIIGGRLGHVFFYEPVYYFSHWKEIFFVWQGGASSLGGFLGAGIAIYIFSRLRHFTYHELLPYFDILSVSFWLGWGIGRIGCFFIHDHPGRLSNFLLAVNFPDGARFDLGLLESLLSFLIFVVFAVLFKRIVKSGWGRVFVYSFLVFFLIRFGLDFLRAVDLESSDSRYWFLTPMQWGVLFMFCILTIKGIYSKISARKI